MRSTVFHNIIVATEVLKELYAVKESVHIAMIVRQQGQEELENPRTASQANFAGQLNNDQSQTLAFLKKLHKEAPDSKSKINVTKITIVREGSRINIVGVMVLVHVQVRSTEYPIVNPAMLKLLPSRINITDLRCIASLLNEMRG